MEKDLKNFAKKRLESEKIERDRKDFAKIIFEIENAEIVNLIYNNSNILFNNEIERHRQIVSKGRDYLGMILIVLGIIIGIGNLFFTKPVFVSVKLFEQLRLDYDCLASDLSTF